MESRWYFGEDTDLEPGDLSLTRLCHFLPQDVEQFTCPAVPQFLLYWEMTASQGRYYKQLGNVYVSALYTMKHYTSVKDYETEGSDPWRKGGVITFTSLLPSQVAGHASPQWVFMNYREHRWGPSICRSSSAFDLPSFSCKFREGNLPFFCMSIMPSTESYIQETLREYNFGFLKTDFTWWT